jgi:hypothetical protein
MAKEAGVIIMQIPEEEWRSLSHRQRRVLVNKERRRRKRKTAALKREEDRAVLESQPGYLERLAAEEKLEEERGQKEEAERLLEHEAWLEREKKAQDEFRRKREKEEKAQKEKEERERLIREEWELLQKKEKEAEEKKERQRQKKEVMEFSHRRLRHSNTTIWTVLRSWLLRLHCFVAPPTNYHPPYLHYSGTVEYPLLLLS